MYTLFVMTILLSKTYGYNNKVTNDTLKIENENIFYSFTQDKHYIHLNVRTNDRRVMQTMLREGVSVYFDNKGKKKKNVFVRYPLLTEKPESQRRERPSSPPNEREERTQEKRNIDVNKIINELPQKAVYGHFDLEQEFHLALNNLNIDVSFLPEPRHGLSYSLKIPKSKINADPKKNLSKLSIGVIIGRDNDNRPSSNSLGGKPNNGGGGQMQGRGGGPPGGGGQGRGGVQNGNRQQGQNGQRTQKSTISYWFKANS